ELSNLWDRFFCRDRTKPRTIFGWNVFRFGLPDKSSTAALACARRPDCAIGKSKNVVLLGEISGIEFLWIHDIEWKLELFEDPSHPPRWHKSAILIVKRDAHGSELQHVFCRTIRHAVHIHAQLFRSAFECGPCSGRGRNPNSTRSDTLAVHFARFVVQPIDLTILV